MKRTQDNMPEFRGQMVDILEDMLAEKGATIENEDRDEAIGEGEDPEGCAIIYGCDYDLISEPVQGVVEMYSLLDFTVTDEAVKEAIVAIVMDGCRDVIDKAEFPDGGFTDEDYKALEDKIAETFTNWEMFG